MSNVRLVLSIGTAHNFHTQLRAQAPAHAGVQQAGSTPTGKPQGGGQDRGEGGGAHLRSGWRGAVLCEFVTTSPQHIHFETRRELATTKLSVPHRCVTARHTTPLRLSSATESGGESVSASTRSSSCSDIHPPRSPRGAQLRCGHCDTQNTQAQSESNCYSAGRQSSSLSVRRGRKHSSGWYTQHSRGAPSTEAVLPGIGDVQEAVRVFVL